MVRYVFKDDDDDDDWKTHCCGNREKNICVEDWSSFPSEELCPIRMIIENNDADKFDSFLRKSKLVYRKDDEMLKYAGFEMCPYGILGKICHHRASKCATLLLSRRRKVGSLMKLNIVNCYGSYPIHDAAISLSASLVKLFLDRGASLDARSLDVSEISPLEYAVERLSCDRNLIHRSPKKSVFKLIITLCLPQMKEALESIDLLAGVSDASTVMNDTIFSAVNRGQVVPVAVLLLLARDRVMQSFYQCNTVSSGRYLLFPEAIMNELGTLINQESALMGSKEHVKILQLCRERKELMIYFLKMIEIFNRAGPALKSYLKIRTSDVTNEQVSYHVAELLKGAGFILSTDDHDISDITSSAKPDLVPLDATLKQQGYDEEDDPKEIFFKPCREQLCRCDMRIPSCTTSNVFQRIVGTSFLYNHHRGFSSRAGPSIHRPLWTIPRREICSLACSPNVFGKVGPCDKKGSSMKHKSGNWFQLRLSKKAVRNIIPWTPQMYVHELLSIFHGNAKVKSLMVNISILTSVTPRIHYVITEYSLQGKVVELAALLKVASSNPIDFSTIIKVKDMDSIRTLWESAERGDLNGFDVKQQLTVELTDGSSEGSQDESKVNTIAPQYLKNSLLYVEPSKFQPPGIFNSLIHSKRIKYVTAKQMPRGYKDSLKYYDGLDIRNCNALAETIFRVLDGRKFEELNLEDTRRFRYCLENLSRK